MKTAICMALGALFGLGLCLGTIQILNASEVSPHFPAYGGDEDFAIRFNWFVLMVVPGFLFIGGWIGLRLARYFKSAVWAAVGAMCGTLAFVVALVLLKPVIESLSTQDSANRGAVLSYLAWLALAALGGYFGARLGGPTKT